MNKHFFDLARIESYKATYSGYSAVKIGCVAVYKNGVIAKGYNSNKTSTTQYLYNKYRYNTNGKKYFPSLNHAETEVYRKIRYLDIDFSKVNIYLYRETKNKKVAMSRPCLSCFKMLQNLGIKNIYYTTNLGFAHEIIGEINDRYI